MKSLTFRIAIVAALTAVLGLTGCNTKNDTVSQITVTPAIQSMATGSTTQQFRANATFSNGMIVDFTQVVNWISSDPNVATVNNTPGQNGIVTSSATGTTILTAFDVANDITGTALIHVTSPESIQIVPTNSVMPVGGQHQFSAIALFSGGTFTQAITTFATWTTLSPSPGVTIINTPTVAGNGTITATVPGITVIKASDPYSTATGTAAIAVTSSVLLSPLAVSPINSVISTGTTTQFTAIGTFQDGTTTQTLLPSLDASWAWSSSNPAAATIDYYKGIATAGQVGTTTITATDLITGVTGNTTLTIQ